MLKKKKLYVRCKNLVKSGQLSRVSQTYSFTEQRLTLRHCGSAGTNLTVANV